MHCVECRPTATLLRRKSSRQQSQDRPILAAEHFGPWQMVKILSSLRSFENDPVLVCLQALGLFPPRYRCVMVRINTHLVPECSPPSVVSKTYDPKRVRPPARFAPLVSTRQSCARMPDDYSSYTLFSTFSPSTAQDTVKSRRTWTKLSKECTLSSEGPYV